jgi:peptidoglycan/LPS O-acetylase OafA/YrhL
MQLADNLPGIFIAQSIIFWTVGIELYLRLHVNRGVSPPLAKLAVFVVGVITTAICAELVHRLVDLPSQRFARATFTWLMR